MGETNVERLCADLETLAQAIPPTPLIVEIAKQLREAIEADRDQPTVRPTGERTMGKPNEDVVESIFSEFVAEMRPWIMSMIDAAIEADRSDYECSDCGRVGCPNCADRGHFQPERLAAYVDEQGCISVCVNGEWIDVEPRDQLPESFVKVQAVALGGGVLIYNPHGRDLSSDAMRGRTCWYEPIYIRSRGAKSLKIDEDGEITEWDPFEETP